MQRHLRLTDLFEIRCKKCLSTDVNLFATECETCGTEIQAYCYNCKSEFDYHEFKMIEE